jgi:hypothetical protein
MSASNASVLFAQSVNSEKIIYLPAVSTVPGRILYVKDISGNASPSTIFLSTAAGDMIDYKRNTVYAQLTARAGLVKLASNGINNWMVLGNYTDAIGQPPYIPPVPPPPPFSGWFPVTDGDGSVIDNGGGSYTCTGPNDGGGDGWAYIYGRFGTAGSFTYNFDFATFDGIFYDWPFEFVTAADASNPANVNFSNKIASSSFETGSRTVSYAANDYVVLGVYSSDSVAGNGVCTFSSLPT